MTIKDALRQLCKMQGLIAQGLDVETSCVCGDPQGARNTAGDVPSVVITTLWDLVDKRHTTPVPKKQSMAKEDARRELCQMQNMIATALGAKTTCVCGEVSPTRDVPDAVISALWALVSKHSITEG